MCFGWWRKNLRAILVMGDKLYSIEIKKCSCNKAIFDYPCQTVDDKLLQNRRIFFVGECDDYSELINKLGKTASIVDSANEATDIIILPNVKRAEKSSIEGYYQELAYYHDACCEYLTPACNNVHNMIVLLPPHSTEYSTHYSQMADYATSCYIDGLSKHGARIGKFVYGLELAEDMDYKSLYDIILYLLSSNSNHMICDIIKLDR